MDRIIMKNLAFFSYHGVMEEEKTLGQKFFLDIELFSDLKKACETDEVKDTIHYGEVYEVIEKTVKEKRFKLIEALAEEVASEVLSKFEKVLEINVVVRKPEAPVAAIFDYVGVEIRRKR